MGWFSKRSAALSPGDLIRFYRDLGFFADGSLQDCVDSLLSQFNNDWGRALNTKNPWDDVMLLSYDEENVWADDPECDVSSANQVYREVLCEWALISKGVFAVDEVKESWETDEGPITVSFKLNGQAYVLHPEYHDDWLDLDVLVDINHLIARSDKQFACASDVNFAVVFVLDAETKKQLRMVRQFPFAI